MASGGYGPVLRQVGRLLRGGTASALGEGPLLRRFAADGDGAAFEALVSRHGPMVLGTCRRILADPHDVEDAFQATFLVLARKAGSIRDGDRLGPWLHGVARRVATRSRALSARRNARERPGGEDRAVAEPDSSEAAELRAALDEELARLPEKYRAPLVFCYLQGMTHDEAAHQLGWPVGTVRSRLAGGRDRLRARLTRRGLAPSAATPAILPVAAIPETLLSSTVRIATAAGSAPAHVASLAKGALVAMMWNKLKVVAAVGLLAGLTVGGAGVAAQHGGKGKAEAPDEAASPPEPIEELSREIRRLKGELDTIHKRVELIQFEKVSELRVLEERAKELRARSELMESKWKALVAAAPASRVEGLLRERDLASMEVRRLETEVLAARAVLTKLVDRLKAEAPIPSPPEGPADPFVLATADELKAKAAPPAPPTVQNLKTDLVLVVPTGHDRATVLNTKTGDRKTCRLPGRLTRVTSMVGPSLMALDFQGPEIRGVAVFDFRAGEWSTQDLREPAKGRLYPTLSASDAAYHTGRSLYCYLGEARKWGVLEAKGAMTITATVGYRGVIAPALEGPEIAQVVVMDSTTGECFSQDLREPFRGQLAPIGNQFASAYPAGRFVYAFSGAARKWGVLELTGPARPAVFGDQSQGIVIPDGDLIHIFQAKTGEWAHLDTRDEK